MALGKVDRGLGGFVQLAILTRATLIVLGSKYCADKDGVGVLTVKVGAQCEVLCYPVFGVVVQYTAVFCSVVCTNISRSAVQFSSSV